MRSIARNTAKGEGIPCKYLVLRAFSDADNRLCYSFGVMRLFIAVFFLIGLGALGDLAAAQVPTQAPSSTQPADAQPATAIPDSTGLTLVKRVEPTIPKNPEGALLVGDVRVRIHLNETGDVETAEAVTDPNRPTNPLVVAAAVDAVRHWKYAPYIHNGHAVEVNTSVKVGVGNLTGGALIFKPAPVYGPQPVELEVVATRKPYYDPHASAALIQGEVLLELTISESGDVAASRVLRGHPMLKNGLPELSREWKFKPPTLNGQPVMATVQIPVRFTPPDAVIYPQPGAHLSGTQTTTPAKARGAATDGSAAADAAEKVVSGVDAIPIHQVQPEVPEGIDIRKDHGTVKLDVLVGVDGSVLEATPASGPAAFYEACIKAAKQWKFQPYVYKGRTERVKTQVSFTFEAE